jgi:nucleoside-diphosphate-sugar epimerase
MGGVLITGGLGYVGRHIVRRLGEMSIPTVSYNRDYSEVSGPNLTSVQGELFDIPRLVRVIEAHEIDRVIHTAAMSHPDLSIELPITTVAANIDGTVHLLEACRLAGVRKESIFRLKPCMAMLTARSPLQKCLSRIVENRLD